MLDQGSQLSECSNTINTLDLSTQKVTPMLMNCEAEQKENIELRENIQFPAKPIKRQLTQQNKSIEQVLKLNQQDGINFGQVLPGNICEEDIILTGLTSETIIVQVLVVCLNQEFSELDEYVFSIRKSNGYDYNDKLILAIQGRQSISLKVALKVPNVKQLGFFKGSIIIQTQGFEKLKISGQYQISAIAQLQLPLLTCPRMMTSILYDLPIIKLAFKSGRKVDCKIPFKNNSTLMLPLEIDLLLNKNTLCPFELSIHPQAMTIQPNAQIVVVLGLKQKQQITREPIDLNQILVIKVRNSSIHFSYPLCVRIY